MVAKELANRGAQLVLLTHYELTDPFLVDYIMDLRTTTNNELITAEHVDLASLHSIRLFATKWIDNSPPRRLDMVILCANTMTPPGGKPTMTEDGLESSWGVNYMANFHLLSILSPAIRAQPADRDVRIIVGMCSSYMGGSLSDLLPVEVPSEKPGKKGKTSKPAAMAGPQQIEFKATTAYANSKFALFTFATAFQKHLDSYVRADKSPVKAKVIMVDPGWTRTPGMLRYLTFGSLWGLLVYLVMWPIWWLVLKSPIDGAQSFIFAAMEEVLGRAEGALFIKECHPVRVMKPEVGDEGMQKVLWEESDKMITALETESALRRAEDKKNEESAEKAKKANETTASEGAAASSAKQPGSRRSRKAA